MSFYSNPHIVLSHNKLAWKWIDVNQSETSSNKNDGPSSGVSLLDIYKYINIVSVWALYYDNCVNQSSENRFTLI